MAQARPSKVKRESYRIYTDGSFRKPTHGSYVAIIFDGTGGERIIQKGVNNSTINRLELLGIITALESIEHPADIQVFSDSQYATYSASRWLPMWRRNNFIRSTGEPVRNVDLLLRLADQIAKHNVTVQWVRGHADDPFNERADAIAQNITFSMRLGTYTGEIDDTEGKTAFG